jgi:four helix bundle protein
MMPYQKLLAWKACHELAVEVYQATNSWPRTERYGLTAQVRKAVYSAPACIAEGSAKRGRWEFRRYLDISNGSLSELSYALQLARDLKIVDSQEYERLESLRANAGRLTWLLYRSLKDGQGGKGGEDGKVKQGARVGQEGFRQVAQAGAVSGGVA